MTTIAFGKCYEGKHSRNVKITEQISDKTKPRIFAVTRIFKSLIYLELC